MSVRALVVLASAGVLSSAALGQSFTPGNLVISIVDVTAGNNAFARPVTVQQFDLTAPLAGSLSATRLLALPASPNATTTVANSFMFNGSATSEGLISLSPDRSSLALAGYNTYLGRGGNAGTNSLATSFNFTGNTATTGAGVNVPRIVASIPANYSATSFTLMGNTFSGGNPRSAVSDGAGGFLLGGTSLTNTTANRLTGGARQFTTGPNSFNLTGAQGSDPAGPSLVNTRFVGQGPTPGSVAIATQSSVTSVGGPGIYTVSGTNAVPLAGFSVPTGSLGPNDFQFLGNTLYVADDGVAGSGAGQWGGLQRWDFDGAQWNLSYLINQINTGSSTVFSGLRSLTVINDGTSNIIYGIDNSQRLVGVVDAGASSVMTQLAVGTSTMIFRGVEMTPGTLVPTPGAASLIALGGLAAARRRRR